MNSSFDDLESAILVKTNTRRVSESRNDEDSEGKKKLTTTTTKPQSLEEVA